MPNGRLFTEAEVGEAVTWSCSCGGKGPDDKGVCPACMMWHRLVHKEKDSDTSENNR